jgi:hypothetical protein
MGDKTVSEDTTCCVGPERGALEQTWLGGAANDVVMQPECGGSKDNYDSIQYF